MTPEEQQQAELDALTNQAQQDETAGEFIPKDEPPKEKANALSSADAMSTLLVMSFGLLTNLRGEHWNIPRQALEEAGEGYGDCLDHYSGGTELPKWLGAGLTTVMLVAPPLMAEKEINEAKRQAEQAGEAKEQGDE